MASSKEMFLSILSSVKKEGVDKLISYLEKSTFYQDPASAEEYNPYEGGLVDHSLNVYNTLEKLAQIQNIKTYEDSLKIVGLLHDISLIGSFQKMTKNVTVKGPDGKNKRREDGRILFIEKEVFEFIPEVSLPYPRGYLSVRFLKQFLKLTNLEEMAIYWHTALQEPPTNLSKRALQSHWLVTKLAQADLEAKLFQGGNK